jgi:hypothetical protein
MSPQEGRKGSDESPVRLNGLGIRTVQPCNPVASVEIHVEPYGSGGWIGEISRAWARGLENTLQLARLLHQARRSIKHGQWSRFWRSQQVPFPKRTAGMLVIIGEGPDGTDAQTFARLPAGWNMLYYIAQLGQELAGRLTAEGRIHPRLRLRQARELIAEFRPELAQKRPASSPLERRLDEFSKLVLTHAASWSRADCRPFHAVLKNLFKAVPLKSKVF